MDEHLLPIPRRHQHVPPAWKAAACRLSQRVGCRKAAYVYNVAEGTVRNWRTEYAAGRFDEPGTIARAC